MELQKKSVLLDKTKAKILVGDARNNVMRPVLQRIDYDGERFAYYTNRFYAIRWDLGDLGLPKDAHISLSEEEYKSDAPNMKFDTNANLATWLRIAGARSTFDLCDTERWSMKDKGEYPEVGKLFKTVTTKYGSAKCSVNPKFFSDCSNLVSGNFEEGIDIALVKSTDRDYPNFMIGSYASDVVALLVPMRSTECNDIDGINKHYVMGE